MNIDNIKAICDAMVSLMSPLVEVVIHDLGTKKVNYIAGSLSGRKIGSPSLLSDELGNLDKVIYPKINFDGRLIKSISAPLKEGNKTTHLLCINCDISLFAQMQNLANQLIHSQIEKQPESLFKNDWQERLHQAIQKILTQNNWQFSTLNTAQKKSLLKSLFDSGAFTEKHAADYIAEKLEMGRATIYKYLKEWRSI